MMPAALYGYRKKEFEIITSSGILGTTKQVAQPLLCEQCEQRFNLGGESHVLGIIAGKSKRLPLHEQMRVAHPHESGPLGSPFHGPEFGLDGDKFTYFAISVVWRAVAVKWLIPDGTLTEEINLGAYQDNMRRYLLGETLLPLDMAVIVIICSDDESRKHFFHPSGSTQNRCINFKFLARGILFWVMIGRHIPPFLRERSCTSFHKCIWYRDCERLTLEAVYRQ